MLKNRFEKVVYSIIIMTVGIGAPVCYVSSKENEKKKQIDFFSKRNI